MKDLFGYIKLGRLNKKIANKINRKPADIFIEYNNLRHIGRGRYEYLKKIQLNALTFVQKIVAKYTEIREGRNGSLILVAHIEDSDVKSIAVIELQLIAKDSMYIVKTAMPRLRFTKSEIVIWKK
jgi:heterodisulfide reductase subunit A-like polyferredoxin